MREGEEKWRVVEFGVGEVRCVIVVASGVGVEVGGRGMGEAWKEGEEERARRRGRRRGAWERKVESILRLKLLLLLLLAWLLVGLVRGQGGAGLGWFNWGRRREPTFGLRAGAEDGEARKLTHLVGWEQRSG